MWENVMRVGMNVNYPEKTRILGEQRNSRQFNVERLRSGRARIGFHMTPRWFARYTP